MQPGTKWVELLQAFFRALGTILSRPATVVPSIPSPPTSLQKEKPATIPNAPEHSPTPTFEPPLSTGFLVCPIQANDSDGKPVTAYTAKISAVIDHEGTNIDPASNKTWGLAAKDQKVKAFNGDFGDGKSSAGAPYGYTRQVPEPFFINGPINYVGAPGSGDMYGPTYYLNYDGHAGYDFSYAPMTPIQATADGDLYKATSDSVNGINRNWYRTKFGKDNTTAWEGWHTFYIKHANGYSSYFLHCTKLIDEIGSQLSDYQKSVPVKQGAVVAYTGGYGGVGPHLHFEVRDSKGKIIDPYADKLWV